MSKQNHIKIQKAGKTKRQRCWLSHKEIRSRLENAVKIIKVKQNKMFFIFILNDGVLVRILLWFYKTWKSLKYKRLKKHTWYTCKENIVFHKQKT